MKLEVEKGMVVLWIAAVFAVGDQAEWNLVEWVAGFVHRACTGNAERQGAGGRGQGLGVRGQSSVISHQWSVVSGQSSVVSRQSSVVSRQSSF